jgi:hypothetical protein
MATPKVFNMDNPRYNRGGENKVLTTPKWVEYPLNSNIQPTSGLQNDVFRTPDYIGGYPY